MSRCQNCGAPITLSADAPTVCEYCGASNDPPPREVEVPVPVQVVQNVVQVQGAPAGAPAELCCPHCHQKLVGVVAKGVELDGCGGCGGIWVNNASVRSVMARPEEIFAELAKRAGDGAHHRLVRARHPRCPVCSARIDERRDRRTTAARGAPGPLRELSRSHHGEPSQYRGGGHFMRALLA